MDALTIKYQNNNYTVTCLTHNFKQFLYELDNKLKNSFFSKGCFCTCFSFSYHLSAKQLYDLYMICDENNTMIKEINDNKTMVQLAHKHDCFNVGETYYISKDMLYIGDIQQGVEIISGANLYIIGSMEGTIDLLYPHLEVCSHCFNEAKIRIFDTSYQKTTINAPCKVYYKDELITYI